MQTPLVRAVSGRVDIAQLRDPIATTPNLQALAIDQVRFPKPMPLVAAGRVLEERCTVVDLTSRVTAAGIARLDRARRRVDALRRSSRAGTASRSSAPRPAARGTSSTTSRAQPITHYLQRFDSAFAGRNVSGVRAFFNDSYEVDDASGQGDWTPRLFDEFRARRGYDLRRASPRAVRRRRRPTARGACSPTIARPSPTCCSTASRRRGPSWAHGAAAIIRNQAHGSPANILDLYAASDIPETEGTELDAHQFATSAAHVAGKRLASAEAATWLTEHFVTKLSDVRTALDNYFLDGVNHVVYHGTAYSPAREPWPGRLFYAAVEFNPQNSWWRDFSELNAYVTRVQSFLQSGQPDNDVLLYFPIFDRFAERRARAARRGGGGGFACRASTAGGFAPPARHAGQTARCSSTSTPSRPRQLGVPLAADCMLARGYAYDYVSDRQLAGVKVEDAALVSPGGRALSHRARARDAVHPDRDDGASRPARRAPARRSPSIAGFPPTSPASHDLDGHRARLRAIVGALKFTPSADGAVKRAPLGRGAVLVGDDLGSLLGAAGARHEPAAALDLQLMRRRERDGYTYFIVNTSGRTRRRLGAAGDDARVGRRLRARCTRRAASVASATRGTGSRSISSSRRARRASCAPTTTR